MGRPKQEGAGLEARDSTQTAPPCLLPASLLNLSLQGTCLVTPPLLPTQATQTHTQPVSNNKGRS